MIKKTTLIVLLCAMALAGAVYYFDWKRGAEKPAVENSELTFSIQASDIVWLTLAHPGKPAEPAIRLEKEKDGWKIVQPVETGADQPSAQGIVDGLASAQVSQTEPGDPGRLKAFGLDPGRVSVEFQLQNGAKHTLLLGDKDFTGDGVYSVVDAGKSVSVLPGSLLTSADKSLEDLRDRAVLHATSEEAASFTLKNSSGEIAASKKDSEWQLTTPGEARADESAVNSLLAAVTTAKMASVASEKPENPGKYGLANPSITFAVTDGKGQTTTLLVGKKEDNTYFARDTSRPTIFTIDEDLHKKLVETYGDLRDKMVLHFDAENITGIELRDPHGTIVLAQGKNGDWTVLAPEAQKGKSAANWKILDVLTDLHAQEVLDHPPADLVQKLDKASIEAVLTEKDGKKLTLRISAPPSGKADDANAAVYAQASDGPALFKLKKEDFDSLNLSPTQILP
jgi:Domain of unknown function (DUF4340)